MIEFEVLAMKADTNKLYTIFLLKKNVQANIIKIILRYLLMTAPETLKEWKIAITLVGQGYKSIKRRQDYKTGTRTIHRERNTLINIRKAKDNFNKDRKPTCFNCNIYGHIAKNCKKPRKKQDTRKCYKCKKIEHIVKDCKAGQKIKNQNVQEDTDIEKDNKEQDFGDSPKQA